VSAALARIPDPPWTRAAGRVASLLALQAALERACEPVTLATIARWSPDERAEAYLWAIGFVRWASVEHLPEQAP
jgi:hypothetical protein